MEECEKQWRSKQEKFEWKKQKKEEKKEKVRKKQEKEEKKKKERKMEVSKVAEEQEIQDKEEETAKSEKKTKRLVPERFHKQIYIFGKKASEQMSIKKLQNHTINMKEEFVLKKRKVYPLSREEREEVHEFISEQLRKEYIKLLKSPQMAPVFFVGKKDGKKRMVQDYRYLNKWTIKNNYPLPLILNIVENIGIKKVFTKMNLRWGYNNI